MFEKAKTKMNKKIVEATSWKEFMEKLNQMNVVKTPWCKRNECEDDVKV